MQKNPGVRFERLFRWGQNYEANAYPSELAGPGILMYLFLWILELLSINSLQNRMEELKNLRMDVGIEKKCLKNRSFVKGMQVVVVYLLSSRAIPIYIIKLAKKYIKWFRFYLQLPHFAHFFEHHSKSINYFIMKNMSGAVAKIIWWGRTLEAK